MKIQSISDIITNSSSEVFIMLADEAERLEARHPEGCGCFSSERIDEHFIEVNKWELYAIYEALGENLSDHYPCADIDDKDFYAAMNYIMPKFEEVFKKNRYVFLDIEDHFEGYDDVYEEAEDLCLWFDYRH